MDRQSRTTELDHPHEAPPEVDIYPYDEAEAAKMKESRQAGPSRLKRALVLIQKLDLLSTNWDPNQSSDKRI